MATPLFGPTFRRGGLTQARIYIASFFDTRARLLTVRETLRSLGAYVTSRWLDEVIIDMLDLAPAEQADVVRGYAERDIADIGESDVLLLDTFDVTPRGGREVELGYAMALGIPTGLVGPVRNVFHELVNVQFKTWEEVYQRIRDVRGAQ